MKIYRSNRAEILLEALAGVIGENGGDPFSPITIAVQSKGMETWLSMGLARRFGVWALPDFPFPRQLVGRIVRSALGADAEAQLNSFNPDLLTFRLAECLPKLIDDDRFLPLRDYLSTDRGSARLLQLSQRIAGVFDQYAVYRTDMLLKWEAGIVEHLAENDHWQPVLWNHLIKEVAIVSPPRLFNEAMAAFSRVDFTPREALPRQLYLFGIASLPPVYLQIFGAFARHVPVHFFLLAPSEHYWGDIRSEREKNRNLSAQPGMEEQDLHLDIGNRLLASLGMLGRDFHRLLEESVEYEEPSGDLFGDIPSQDRMLDALQHDIYHLVERRSGDDVNPLLPLDPDDDSLQISSCHSPLREVEILHDYLLDIFNESTEHFRPQDVVVMLPDVEAYAPLVDAVFGREVSDAHRIPYRIADRSVQRTAPLVELFLRLLVLPVSRLTASEVMEILAQESIRRNFSINEAALGLLRNWVDASGIRWAIDEAHRTVFSQPADRQNTWSFGIDRLVLGYAMPGGDRHLFSGLVPCGNIEAQDGELLGEFIRFAHTLFMHIGAAAVSKSLKEWAPALHAMLDALFYADGESQWQIVKIRDSIDSIAADAEAALYFGDVDSLTLRDLLLGRLESKSGAHGFLDGGVTFCAMLPMRSIPFKVVCLLGMNDGTFPRSQAVNRFDLISRQPKVGDRSRRLDDLYLFLEALLAARSRLYISYVGRSVSNNSLLPPSPLVDLLLDEVRASFFLDGMELATAAISDRNAMKKRLVAAHPLQPFSPRYFDGSDYRLFSYSARYCKAARVMLAGGEQPRTFLKGYSDAGFDPGGQDAILLAELKHFFKSSSRWFLERKLGIYFADCGEMLEDREPLEMNALDLFRLRSDLLQHQRDGLEYDACLNLLRGSGRLPLGRAGDVACLDSSAEALQVAKKIRALSSGSEIQTGFVTIELDGGIRMTGELSGLCQNRSVRGRGGSINSGFLLECWIDHLFSCAALQEKMITTTMVGYKKGVVVRSFAPVTGAIGLMNNLVSIFLLGQRQVVPFFPKSAFMFAETLRKGKKEYAERLEAARSAARKEFHGGRWNDGPNPESACPYVRQLYDGQDPLSADFANTLGVSCFEELAIGIMVPLLDHLTKES